MINAALNIGIAPEWLASIIQFESGGSFSPSKENAAGSGAVGLIQFMPSTAQGLLGTSTPQEATAQMKAMSFAQQLEYVKKYFAPYVGKLQSLEDTYLAVFYPAFIGKPLDAVLGQKGSAIYDQNAGFDKTGKGFVTKEDITSTIRGVLNNVTSWIHVPTGRLIQIAERGVTVLGAIAWASLVAFLGLGAAAVYQHHKKTGHVVPTLAEVKRFRWNAKNVEKLLPEHLP